MMFEGRHKDLQLFCSPTAHIATIDNVELGAGILVKFYPRQTQTPQLVNDAVEWQPHVKDKR